MGSLPCKKFLFQMEVCEYIKQWILIRFTRLSKAGIVIMGNVQDFLYQYPYQHQIHPQYIYCLLKSKEKEIPAMKGRRIFLLVAWDWYCLPPPYNYPNPNLQTVILFYTRCQNDVQHIQALNGRKMLLPSFQPLLIFMLGIYTLLLSNRLDFIS